MQNLEITPALANQELAKRELARRHLLDFVTYNFPSYDTNWHHNVLASKLEAVERGEIKKLAVFMPPRHGKSELTSLQFPAWILGKRPKTKIIMSSYNDNLATDFGRRTRNLVNTQEYRNVFDINLAQDSKSAGRWNTDKDGYYVSVGIGGAATGKGADILIIDDPHKNRKEAESVLKRKEVLEWYRSTAKTRLSPDGAVILVLTRWHDGDLAGMILDDTWEIVEFKAIAEEDDQYRKKGEALWESKFSKMWLEQQKKDIGTFEFSSLYQQTPLDTEHAEFKKNYFQYITRAQLLNKKVECFLTIDTALSKQASADYTGFIDNYVDTDQKWNISAERKKVDTAELINEIFNRHEIHNYTRIGIESTILFQAIEPFLVQEQQRRNIYLPIIPVKHNQVAKELRIRGLLPRYQNGGIYHLEGECDDLESELIRFPKSTHDDLCLVGDTLILTENGSKKIEDIKAGEFVLTRKGYREVTESVCTGFKEVVTNIGLTGTYNHPVITKNGIVDLAKVKQSDILYIWNEKLLCIKESSFTDILSLKEDNTGYIFGLIRKAKNVLFRFTDISGQSILEKLKKVLSYTTKTATHLITILVILVVCRLLIICLSIWNLIRGKILLETHLISIDTLQKNGTEQSSGLSGINNTLRLVLTNQKKLLALSVGKKKQDSAPMPDSVPENVTQSILQENSERGIPITIRKVYNLTVDGENEYIANGVLVHNCDSLAYMSQIVTVVNSDRSVYENFVDNARLDPRTGYIM